MNLKLFSSKITGSGVVLMFVLLAAVLAVLLGGGCLPGHTFFSNDGPLGRLMSADHRLPERFTGCWEDLNSVGYRALAAVPSLTFGLEWLLGPLWFSRLYLPLALLLLGMSAWWCLRRFGLVQAACVLGGLAAALNSAFFSSACWGVAAHAITVGMAFLALGTLFDSSSQQRWVRTMLAGLALGMVLLLGMSAWWCLRRFGLVQAAGVLGGLAAALNSAFFSSACGGVAAHAIAVAIAFLALGTLFDSSSPQRWVRTMLAGLALGMAVTEGADIGAIFSVFVAGFVVWRACVSEGPRAKNVALGVLRVVVAALCAGVLAAQAISELVVTDVMGVVAATEHGAQTKQGHWDWATQWSLPKTEALGLIVPGLFGYRVDSTGGAAYWGATGQDAAWTRFLRQQMDEFKAFKAATGPDAAWTRFLATDRRHPPPSGFLRFVGGGNYVGVPVVLVAVWTAVQCLRRKNSVFEAGQRRLLWFWLAAAVVSLLLAFGRYAPFYQWFYALPYASKIRNPVKFIHVFSFAVIVLLAYGVDGLWRRYLRPPGLMPSYRWAGFKSWWNNAAALDRRWLQGCLLVLGLSLVAWAIYAHDKQALEDYLHSVEFDVKTVGAMADFSIRQVGWFVLFFTLASGLMAFILSGALAGRRAVWGAILLGAVLVVDLARADQRWIFIWDYAQKYLTNPIVDRLREKPHEHRVADMPREFLEPEFQAAFGKANTTAQTDYLLYQVYSREWAQHLFCYYNIQSLDIVQLPRKPEDLKAFEAALTPDTNAVDSTLFLRRWQLTNTRYVLGTKHFFDYFNQRLDPERHRLRVVERFSFVPKPGFRGSSGALTTADVTASTNVPPAKAVYALLEFTGALPRSRLYRRWQVTTNDQAALSQLRPGLGDVLSGLGVATNDQAALSRLASPSFDPEQCVLVAEDPPADLIPEVAPPAGLGPEAGTVEFVSYAPKDIVLKADARAPCVLLLNDRFEPDWNVRVDDKPAKLLRCNYIMRGVSLTPGVHRVEFRFQPLHRSLYVSLAGVGLALSLLLFVTVSSLRRLANAPPGAAGSRPPAPRGQGNRKERRDRRPFA